MSLTPAESMELQRLLAKAKSKAIYISKPLDDIDDELSEYDPNTGLFVNPATGESVDIWSASEFAPSSGAMTDGAKRREDALMSHDAKRLMKPKAMAASSAAPCTAYSGTMGTVPFVNAVSLPDIEPEVSIKLPPFPPGVTDVATWGETLIEFGQYKNAGMSYSDLVLSTDDRAVSYAKWCKSRANSSSGQLKDLCDFLSHHFADEGANQGPLIPGTTMTRRLKK